jgi:hypothetical protein
LFLLRRKISCLKKTRGLGRRSCRRRAGRGRRAGGFRHGHACFPNAALQKGILTRALVALNNHIRDVVVDALFKNDIAGFMRQCDVQQRFGGFNKFQMNDHLLTRHGVPSGIAPDRSVTQDLANNKSVPQAHHTSLPRTFILHRSGVSLGRKKTIQNQFGARMVPRF